MTRPRSRGKPEYLVAGLGKTGHRALDLRDLNAVRDQVTLTLSRSTRPAQGLTRGPARIVPVEKDDVLSP
jgi:hypothetical protein